MGRVRLVGGPVNGKTVPKEWAATWWSERTPKGVHIYAPTYDEAVLEHVGLFASDWAYIHHMAHRHTTTG